MSQDGFLRVFNYDKMDLIGVARSYFGGFLCVCWSPDGKYIVVGGEDDLVTVWSLNERRVVARGQGHRSWVSVVAFDPFTSYSQWDGPDFSDDENPLNDGVGAYRCNGLVEGAGDYHQNHHHLQQQQQQRQQRYSTRTTSPATSSSFRDSAVIPDRLGTSYRLGSVSQDTQLCLWDITEDVLRQSAEIRQRLSSHDSQQQQQQQINGAAETVDVGKIKTESVDSSSSSSKFVTANCSGAESGRSSFNDKSRITKLDKLDRSSTMAAAAAAAGSSKSNESSSSSSLTAFNSITQRLSNFSFGNDKKSGGSGGESSSSTQQQSSGGSKRPFTFSKSTGTGYLNNHESGGDVNATSATGTSLKNSKSTQSSSSSSIVPSYDPMQLIGTSVCPRFDECPLLEPLVCKKIAHERLTALIFREDCFLTACQDGFIYTWARPGFSVNYIFPFFLMSILTFLFVSTLFLIRENRCLKSVLNKLFFVTLCRIYHNIYRPVRQHRLEEQLFRYTHAITKRYPLRRHVGSLLISSIHVFL